MSCPLDDAAAEGHRRKALDQRAPLQPAPALREATLNMRRRTDVGGVGSKPVQPAAATAKAFEPVRRSPQERHHPASCLTCRGMGAMPAWLAAPSLDRAFVPLNLSIRAASHGSCGPGTSRNCLIWLHMLLGQSRRWRFAISQRHKRTFRRGTVGKGVEGSAPPTPLLPDPGLIPMELWHRCSGTSGSFEPDHLDRFA